MVWEFAFGFLETLIVSGFGGAFLYLRKDRLAFSYCVGGSILGYIVAFGLLSLFTEWSSQHFFYAAIIGVMIGVTAANFQRTATTMRRLREKQQNKPDETSS